MHFKGFVCKLRAMKNDKARSEEPVIGVAWYGREQWPRLLEISTDRDELEDSYDEWLASAGKTLGLLGSQGLNAVRVDIDTEELLAWRHTRNLPVNAKARTDYTVEKVQKIHHQQPN